MSDQPRNVLIVSVHYPPELTGNAPYVGSLAGGLVSAGDVVSAIVARPHYPEWKVSEGYRSGGTTVAGGVRVTRVRHYVPRHPTALRRLASELSFGLSAALQRWPRHDVLVLVTPALLASAVLLVRGRLSRTKTLVWVQDLYSLGVVETGGSARVGRIMSSLEGAILRSADKVVVIHDRFAEHVQSNLRVHSSRVETVRNWTHLKPTDEESMSVTRSDFGWSDDEVIVLHAGNQGVKQGLENVVEAGRLADSRGSRVRFVLLGKGNQREKLEAAAAGISSVDFLDPMDDAPYQAAMRLADVLLVNELPGVREMSVPSKLTSYFHAGRPVLAATEPGSATDGEVKSSGAGRCVPPGDPAALLDAAESLSLDDPGSYGQNGRAYVERVLSEEAAIGRFRRLIRALRT